MQWQLQGDVASTDQLDDLRILTSSQEAKEGTVSLSEDDPVEVGLMLEFFYYKGYADHMEWRVKHQDRLQNMLELHTRMCILGDKYGCSDLVIFADSAFRDTFDARKRGTRMDVQSLAHDVFELITRFYAYMPDPLRETCINLFRARKEDKERMHDLPLLQAPLLDLMREQPTFAADLVKKLGLRFT